MKTINLLTAASAIVFVSALAVLAQDGAAIFNKGNDQFTQKHYDEAIRTFREYLKVEPDDPAAYLNIGTSYYNMKQYDAALQPLQQAVTMKPDYARAWRYLGGAYFNLKRYNEAVDAYRNAARYQKDMVEAHVWLGMSLENLGKYNEAVAAYKDALALEPDNAAAHFGLGASRFYLGDFAGSIAAIGRWQELAAAAPADAARERTASLYLGHAYMEIGKYDSAVAAFMHVLANDPDNTRALLGLGEVYILMKKPSMAAIQKAKLDKLDPSFASKLQAKMAAANLK